MNRILFEPAEIAGDLDTFGGAANGAQSVAGRLLLAIGPEGGWTDEEVALLKAHGFARHSLGPRILRTDTATARRTRKRSRTGAIRQTRTTAASPRAAFP